MPTPPTVGLSLVVLLASALPAQRFSIDAVAATTMSAGCSVPGLPPVSMSAPAGTPADAIGLSYPFLYNGTDFAAVGVDGVFTRSASGAQLLLLDRAQVRGQGVASTGPHEVLLTMSSTVPLRVVVTLRWGGSDGASPPPVATVDLGDDGVVDFVGRSAGQQMSAPLAIGSAPFAIRLHTAVSSRAGIVASSLECSIGPDLGIATTPQGTACGVELDIASTFEQEVVLSVAPEAPGVAPAFLVIGDRAVPRLLPGPGGCELLPDPMAVALIPPGGLRYDVVALPPLSVLVQAVQLWPGAGEVHSTQTVRLSLP